MHELQVIHSLLFEFVVEDNIESISSFANFFLLLGKAEESIRNIVE